MSDRSKLIAFLLFLFVAAFAAGTSDFEEAQRAEHAYCDMVAAGEVSPAPGECGEAE